MKDDTIQPVIGDLSRWIVTQDPTPEFWIYNLLDFGLYSDSGIANQLIKTYRTTEFQSSLKQMASELTSEPTKAEITVRFFYSAYQKDAEACLGLMDQIYYAYKDDGIDFEEYPALEEIENENITDPNYEANNIEYTPKVEKTYPSRSKFDVYRDVNNEIQEVTEKVQIHDAYIDEKILTLFLADIPSEVNIQILSKNIDEAFEPAAQHFSDEEGRYLQVRTHEDVHDRFIFIDDRCFVIGNSFSNAGMKPTYFIELDNTEGFEKVFRSLWKEGSKLSYLQR